MEVMDPALPALVGATGDEALERALRRDTQGRLFRSVVDDIDRAVTHFNGDLIDDVTLLGVLRDRLAALEQLAQVEVPS